MADKVKLFLLSFQFFFLVQIIHICEKLPVFMILGTNKLMDIYFEGFSSYSSSNINFQEKNFIN